MAGIGNMEIVQWNARSLNNNGSDLKALFFTHKPQIVALQEIWLIQTEQKTIHLILN